MTDPAWQPAEIVRAVERIELDIREIKTDVKQQGAVYVTRGEFEAWRQGIDREVRDIKVALSDGITGIRADLKHQTPQWWVIAALGCSVLSLVVGVVLAINAGR